MASNTQKISVIIPSFNSSRTIEACVESVLATGYPNLEIIIVDDRSTDNSSEMVARLEAAHPKVQQVIQPENGGPAKARNSGANKATGTIYFFLDSDTKMLPDTLHNVSTRISHADVVVGVYHAESLNTSWAPRYKAMLNNFFFSRKGVIDYEVFDSSRAAIKAEIFDAENGFNEDLAWGMDYENEELGYRLCDKYTMVLDPAVQVRHEFPEFGKMTKDYFFRVALWMEIFLKRKRFESGGVTTGGTGLSSAALLGSMGSCVLALLFPVFGWIAALLFCTYLTGYASFFRFVYANDVTFMPTAILLNMYFTIVIACGATWGIIKSRIAPAKEE
ncbi:MAG: glycosyltransferase family 2 protein [Pseudodesulfovibrio sp.]